MTTIKEVAARAKVSIATVSNVITEKKNVSADKRQRVMDAIEALNYVNNRLGSMPKRQSMTIGFIVSQLDTVYFPMIIRGIQKIAEENGYSLIFYPTNYSTQLEKKHLKNMLDSKIDGIILDTVIPSTDRSYWDSLSHITRNGQPVPIVSIQNDISEYGIPSVYLDNFQGGYTATEHLIKNGCKKVACITGPANVRWASARFNGYIKCLNDYGLEYNSSYTNVGVCSPVAGYKIVNHFLLNALEFDGLFAENDLMAVGGIKALLERSIRVPEDVKVIGFDNVFVSSLTTPSVSTIHIPKQRLGEESARVLISMLRNEDMPENFRLNLPLQLVERQSTNSSIESNWDLYLF